MELAKVCLTQIILFNRRREGEVASMPLSAFSSRDTSDPHEDVDWALSEVEKKLCRHFSRIVIRGKRGRLVPILLTSKMLCGLQLLVKQREAFGVLKDNTYLFARPEAMTHFRGSDCIRGFAKVCGAKCPKSRTSTRLRKHAATLSTVLNMTDTEMDQLANFLGHDIRIHREFYRLPEKTLQLAKISKVLMALKQGRLAEFHGKNLDEIGIEPDEKVLDSDEEDSIHGENSSCTVDEPSAEETLSPTKRNEMPPPPPKRRKPPPSSDHEIPSGVSAMRPSSKGELFTHFCLYVSNDRCFHLFGDVLSVYELSKKWPNVIALATSYSSDSSHMEHKKNLGRPLASLTTLHLFVILSLKNYKFMPFSFESHQLPSSVKPKFASLTKCYSAY
ncbi:hypothetical protein LDENG_00288930 [Lucifuga dentata]|nr:hypothetical protein LDENG_00288930 [Lucifuga dentata]